MSGIFSCRSAGIRLNLMSDKTNLEATFQRAIYEYIKVITQPLHSPRQ